VASAAQADSVAEATAAEAATVVAVSAAEDENFIELAGGHRLIPTSQFHYWK
jgi:hypothetical protein